MLLKDAERARNRAAIREMDAEQASQGVLTCKRAIKAAQLNIELSKQDRIAAGRNARRLTSINLSIRREADRIADLDELLAEYEERLRDLREGAGGEDEVAASAPISKPRPPSPVRNSWVPSQPKKTTPLDDLPPSYPASLTAQTHLIICNGVKQFPIQTQVAELCKHVITKLRPLFRRAISKNLLREDMALHDMSELLHYLLVSNCDSDSRRYELKNELKRSEEWLKLNRELARIPATERALRGAECAQATQLVKGREKFNHSDDYCKITCRGTYNLTKMAGQIAKLLHEAHENGKCGIGSSEIRKRLRCGKVWDQFRRRDGRKFWKEFIHRDEKDFFSLNLPTLDEST